MSSGTPKLQLTRKFKTKSSSKSKSQSQSKSKSKSSSKSSPGEIVVTPRSPKFQGWQLKQKPWISDAFIEKAVNHLKSDTTTAKEKPKMLALVGPPAAGKSTVKKQLDFNDAVNVDVDEVKILAKREFGAKAEKIFMDFKPLIQLLITKCIKKKYDIVLDTTGKMKEAIKYAVKKAKQAGYTIDVAIVYSTLELCKTRAAARNISYAERPPMDPEVVEQAYVDFVSSKRAKSYTTGIKDLAAMVDNLYMFDNSRCTPQAALVMERHGNQTLVHENMEEFYDVKLKKTDSQGITQYRKGKGIRKTRKARKTKRRQ